MRKAEKIQLDKFVRLLKQVHKEIKKAVKTKNYENAMLLLEQCQEGAIKAGTLIECTEGEDSVTVGLFENYCELVYEIYNDILSNNLSDWNKAYKNLCEMLTQVENSVQRDIQVRIEIVFLPYKASMWDSLESVWKTADQSPECDAYVIPIPYYDKNPDGSFGAMHYEGNEYPDYVPVTDYKAYDFEKRKPDIIFIHNPYDNFNYVTSVPPYFYSKNLKQFTEMLVYIPYFVLREIRPDDRKEIEGIEHFCTTPAVMHADKVIVQSENMRSVYISVIKEILDKKSFDRIYWGKKIAGLGSPKIDKVCNTKKENVAIPEAWRKIIRKPNGEWKKIVFYNTSVSALLQSDEKMIRKINDVLRIFKIYKNEIVLLWRPHPLIQATIESMRPQLWNMYEEIAERYKEEGWGIYDETADLNRAVAISDAYYGDGSSVVQLFQKKGKQCIIQNVLWKNSTDALAATEAIVYINQDYWFVPYWNNKLYKMNHKIFEIHKIGTFEEKAGSALFSGAVHYGRKIYFIPRLADFLSVYNMEEEKIYQICFQENSGFKCKNSKFSNYVTVGCYLYMIPYNYHSLVRIDMQTDEVESYSVYSGEEEKKASSGNAAVIDGNIYFAYRDESCVLQFDSKRKLFKKVYPNNERKIYSHMFYINNRMWLIPSDINEGIHVWDIYSNKFIDTLYLSEEMISRPSESEIKGFPDSLVDRLRNGDFVHFGAAAVLGTEIHLSAFYYGKNIIIQTKERSIRSWERETECFEEILYTWMRGLRHISYLKKNDELYLIDGISGEWFQYSNGVWKKLLRRILSVRDDIYGVMLDGQELTCKYVQEDSEECKIGEGIFEEIKREWENKLFYGN